MLAQNIDEVVTRLDQIIESYREQNSPLAYFPALYRAVTVNVRDGILHGRFENGDRMNRFDTTFANRYLAALFAHDSGAQPTRAWAEAFGAEKRSDTMVLQHLLLGMNAHINLDLPIAVVAVAQSAQGAPLASLQHDFMTINEILGAMLDKVQTVLDRFSPFLDILDRLGGPDDEAVATFSMKTARDEAWHEATRLDGEVEAMRERSISSLDRRVALLARGIIVPGGPLGLATGLIAHTEHRNVQDIVDALLALT